MDLILLKNDIEELKNAPTTPANVQRLAMLMIVYDQMANEPKIVQRLPDVGEGEFQKAISGKQLDPLIELLTEHMAVVQVIMPKEYRALLDEIKELP